MSRIAQEARQRLEHRRCTARDELTQIHPARTASALLLCGLGAESRHLLFITVDRLLSTLKDQGLLF